MTPTHAGRTTRCRPSAPDIDAYLARFDWHPEPELIGYRDEVASREALRRLGADAWATALDFLYDHAADRAMGDPATYAALRASSSARRAARPRRRVSPPRSPRSSPSSASGSPAHR